MEKTEILKRYNKTSHNNLMGLLQIEYIDVGDDYMVAKMPVTENVTQIDGVLHGGATLALAETVGSMAAFVLFSKEGEQIRGIELSANHVRSAVVGEFVIAKAICLHQGKTLQVWDIKITNESDKLVSICKFTTIRINKET